MWGFRRWILQKQFTLEEYIDGQIDYLLKSLQINQEQANEGNKSNQTCVKGGA
jgi:hypothetical protein